MDPLIPTPECHLCVTHSALVTRVFEAAMAMRGETADSIRTIARRNAPFRGEGICLDDVSDEMEEHFRKCDRKGYRSARTRFDTALRGLTGGRPFHAYLPHLNKMIYQEIISHPNCSGYSFLEEGFTSMAWNTQHNARLTWSKVLRNHLRTWLTGPKYRFSRPMFDLEMPHYRAAYGISSHAFHDMPGRTDVSAFVPPLAAGNPPGVTYIVLDAAYLHQGIPWQHYERALLAATAKHASTGSRLMVKFHFADTDARRKFESVSTHLSRSGFHPIELLDSGYSVEDNLTDCDLVLFAFTSLGYYAALLGANVRCFATEIQGVSLESWVASGRIPPDFASVAGLGTAQ